MRICAVSPPGNLRNPQSLPVEIYVEEIDGKSNSFRKPMCPTFAAGPHRLCIAWKTLPLINCTFFVEFSRWVYALSMAQRQFCTCITLGCSIQGGEQSLIRALVFSNLPCKKAIARGGLFPPLQRSLVTSELTPTHPLRSLLELPGRPPVGCPPCPPASSVACLLFAFPAVFAFERYLPHSTSPARFSSAPQPFRAR